MTKELSSFRVLRSTIHTVQIDDVTDIFERWISARERSHYVAICNVHVMMEAYNDEHFRNVLASADLAVADGTPLIWAGRAGRGFNYVGESTVPICFLNSPALLRRRGTSISRAGAILEYRNESQQS